MDNNLIDQILAVDSPFDDAFDGEVFGCGGFGVIDHLTQTQLGAGMMMRLGIQKPSCSEPSSGAQAIGYLRREG